jgi:hypothetical protein
MRDLGVWLDALVAALVALGLACSRWVCVARSSPRFLPDYGQQTDPCSVGYPERPARLEVAKGSSFRPAGEALLLPLPGGAQRALRPDPPKAGP